MNTLTPVPAIAPSVATEAPRAPLPLRALRVVALLGLSVILSLFIGLALFSVVPVFHGVFKSVVAWFPGGAELRIAGSLILALLVLVTAGVLWTARRFKLGSRWIAGGYLAAAPVLAYLATDEPVFRFPVTVEELAPAFPGAEKSFEVLMRYGNQQAVSKPFKDAVSPFAQQRPKDAEAWRTLVLANRADLEAHWAQLAPEWAWWNELNTFDRIGDLTPARFDAEVLAYRPCRVLALTGCALASLRALDGKGDEAIEILIPIIQVSRKLQPSGRTLVRLMIAIVIERAAMEAAGYVLDHATVSPAAQVRLASALSGGNVEAAARRLMLVDYVVTMGGYVDADWQIGDIIALTSGTGASRVCRLVNVVSPFVYNRRASFNLYGDFIRDMAELLARREMTKFAGREKTFFNEEVRPRFKNFMGLLLMNQAVPSYAKVSQTFWETQDLRIGLLARVTAK